MRTLLLASSLLALLLASAAWAQPTITPRGSAATFDVASWNVERFGNDSAGPSDDEEQIANVQAVVEQAEIDLWAMQEINDFADFIEMGAALRDAGYEGIYGPSVSGNPDFDLRLAYIYNTEIVTILEEGEILEGDAYDFGNRPPYEIRAEVTLGDASREIVFINVHAKAGTSTSDYNRRENGSEALKAYVDERLAEGTPVIVLGDLNDELDGSISGSNSSPYQNFLDDGEDYEFATYFVDLRGEATYCTNTSCTQGSTRDHILFTTNTLGEAYVGGSGDRYEELIEDLSGYVFTTSDHLPALAQFTLTGTSVTEMPEPRDLVLLPPAPNPARGEASVTVRLDRPTAVRMEIIDAVGRRVAVVTDQTLPAGDTVLPLPAGRLTPGLYLVRIVTGAASATRPLTVTR